MPLDAIVLALAAALVHALWNLLLHDTPDREAAMSIAGLVAGVILLPAIIIWPPTAALPWVLLSGLVQTAYCLSLSAAYRHGALTVAYPIARGTAPFLVTIGGWLALSESPSVLSIVGAALLGTGLVLVAAVGRRSNQPRAVPYAILTGILIATYSLIDAHGVRQVQPLGYLGAVFFLQGIFVLGWMMLTGQHATPSPHPLIGRWIGSWHRRLQPTLRPGLLIGAGSLAAYVLVALAWQRADAGRVSTLRELSIVISLLLARSVSSRQAWVGTILVVIGAFLAATF